MAVFSKPVVVQKRLKSNGCIAGAGSVINKGVVTQKRIALAGVATVLTNPFRVWRKRKPGESDWNGQQSNPVRQVVHRIF